MPKTQPKILILTLKHGAAHQRVSKALADALVGCGPQIQVVLADALEHCTSWFRHYYDSYQIPLRYFPSLWGWIENAQHKGSATGPGWLYRRGARPLFQFIKRFDPDVVVASEVGICELVSMFKRETRGRFLLVGLTAGVDVDRPWAQAEVDLYPVSPLGVAEQLLSAGAPKEKVLECGAPVEPPRVSLDRAALRTRLGLEADVQTLLVLFGGTGYGSPRAMVEAVRKLSQPVQTVFIAGRNPRLESRLRRFTQGMARTHVQGWVDNMNEWMQAADLLLSKPGGMTVIEAVNAGLPILAFDPLPGAERRACDLIEQWQVGRWIRRPEDLAPVIESFFTNPAELGHFRRSALSFSRPQAARDAAEAILKLIEEQARR